MLQGVNDEGRATPPGEGVTSVIQQYPYLGQATPPEGEFTTGDRHSCGVKKDVTAVCWGDDDYGLMKMQTKDP